MTREDPHLYEFGPFRLDPSTPVLWRDGHPVSLTLKALETLVALVEQRGRVVSREELIEAVWPDTVVEENNLSVSVSALRKALGEAGNGEKYIETVQRRGYRFNASVRDVRTESAEFTYTRHSRSLTLVEETSETDAETTRPAAARALSIAVLPFNHVGALAGEEYLGIGLCDTVITRLSRVQCFVIRPTSSVVAYGDGRAEPLAAGRELKVDYVIDGRIRRAGETLRVNVQLLRISEEAICWAGQFDEKLTDVLQLEDSIAEQVAIALVPQMTADERERLAKRGTDNPEAFEAYLRGRFHFNSLTEDGFAKALAAYERAVQLDPSYALAHTGIADYYYFLAVWGVMPSNKCLATSETAARRAVEIDPELAEAHAALGFALSGRFNWAEGERHVLRALELSPNSALAHLRYGNHLVQQGFVEEAIQHARRGIELDPLSPIYQFSLGWGLYFARRFDECLQQFRSMTTEHPLNPMAYFGLAWVARHVGRHDEALGAMKRAEELSNGSLMMTTGRGIAYAAAGMRREAEEVLEKIAALPTECYVIPYHVALIHHFLGDREKTFVALEEAFEQRDLWLVWIGVEPAFDSLRSDARFQHLLEVTGLGQSIELRHTRHTRSLTHIEESSDEDEIDSVLEHRNTTSRRRLIAWSLAGALLLAATTLTLYVWGQRAGRLRSVTATAPVAEAASGFDVEGRVTTSFGFADEKAYAAVLQPDGKLVAAGAAGESVGTYDFALARYNPDGALDKTFGMGGKVITALGPITDIAYALALQPDGKIIAAGVSFTSTGNGTRRFALARYNPDGSLDASFDGDGLVTLGFGTRSMDTIYAVVVQPDARIVVAGSASMAYELNGVTLGQNDFALARLDPDGSLDASFGRGGILITDFGRGPDIAYALVLQPDGRILIAGTTTNGRNQDVALARYQLDGALDETFGNGGKVRTDFFDEDDIAWALALQTDGRIVAAGYTSHDAVNEFALVRYNADGSPDTSFGVGGKVATAFSQAGDGEDTVRGIALQADGRIVIAGRQGVGVWPAFAFVRYHPDGKLDTSFDGDGKAQITFPQGGDAYALVLRPDGLLVAAGSAGAAKSSDFAIVRFRP